MKKLLMVSALMALLTSCAHTNENFSEKKKEGYDYWAKYHTNVDRR